MYSNAKELAEHLSEVEKMPAVVAWLDNNVGLEIARTLYEHDVPVIALTSNAGNYRCRSRYIKYVFDVPAGDEGLLHALQELKAILPDGAVFCPTTDALAQIFSSNRSVLEPFYRAAIAEHDNLSSLGDKANVDAVVQERGILAPRTWVVKSLSEAQSALSSCKFPLIIKPSVRTDGWWAAVKEKVLKVDTPEQLMKDLPLWLQHVPSLVIQEWVEGDDTHNYFYLTYFSKNGDCIAELAGRKIRCWPTSTGVGASSEQVFEPKLQQIVHRLLKDIDYQGFCEIEFKRQKGTDDFFFIEANVGRPSLQSTLAESCGIDMQYIMYCDCAGLPLPENTEIKYPGAKCIVWRSEMKAAIRSIARGELSVLSWMKSLGGRKRSIDVHLNDPKVVWGGFLWPVIADLFKRIRPAGR